VDSLGGDCINIGALESRFGAICQPDEDQVGWRVSEVQTAFVTSLDRASRVHLARRIHLLVSIGGVRTCVRRGHHCI